jgi:hypothetical protein
MAPVPLQQVRGEIGCGHTEIPYLAWRIEIVWKIVGIETFFDAFKSLKHVRNLQRWGRKAMR